jgi:hypothetical protein
MTLSAPIYYKHIKNNIMGNIEIYNEDLIKLVKAKIANKEPIELYAGVKYLTDEKGNIIVTEVYEFSIIP